MTTTQSTTGRLAKPLAAIALLAALAACGSADPSGTTPSTTPHSSASTPPDPPGGVTPPHDFAAAKQVTVMQSGGLKPVNKTFVFAMDRPAPDGFSKADVEAVLKAAADPALKTAPPPPNDTCCDRYLYRISISYPDGTSTTFTTVQGDTDMIPAVSELLALAT